MAARKKASKKSSKTVSKKTKASAAATASRKRKAVASSAASRPSRSAAKSKAARSAKAKSGKSETARRSSASIKAAKAPKRASVTAKTETAQTPARALPATAAKHAKPMDTKLRVGENQAREMSKTAGQKPAGVSEAKASREAAAAAAPQAAPAIVKAGTPALAKRAPVAAKAPKAGAPESAPEREEEGAAPKSAKSSAQRQGFKLNEFVVYPAHGVGQIVAVEDQEVAGFRLELFVINFAKDKMTLRVPTSKVAGVGMRKLSEPDVAKRSLEILTGRARIKRTMWSRRAQEYEAKINSGDINAIAEVVRDLYRSDAQPEQSYSERQLYEAALDRMMREIAAVQKLNEIDALKVIEGQLKKAQRRSAKAEAGEGEDAAIEEAA